MAKNLKLETIKTRYGIPFNTNKNEFYNSRKNEKCKDTELLQYVKSLADNETRYHLGCLSTALKYDWDRQGTGIDTFKEFGIPEQFKKIAYLIVNYYKTDTIRKFDNKISKFCDDLNFFIEELAKAEIKNILSGNR